jgi:hypothetical protein
MALSIGPPGGGGRISGWAPAQGRGDTAYVEIAWSNTAAPMHPSPYQGEVGWG